MVRKTWTWGKHRKRIIRIGSGWTRLTVECLFKPSCKDCVFWRYCKNNFYEGKPIIKHVINGLFEKYGEPSDEIIDKTFNV